ncbi:hypothetical protein HELRODRAFT_169269 [Helobdella robusta]|uniref:Uncharacterized protein n=1 Tax=Helobdella robusta TaxID=6412 RepID=T1F1P1_HELRO|nr:hypothetical protein HELRODRAFT_169269 [Helobdella robusta]ESO08427.1 hypothetical protein HELRODRAFT_169269 [Helobdella robusta]
MSTSETAGGTLETSLIMKPVQEKHFGVYNVTADNGFAVGWGNVELKKSLNQTEAYSKNMVPDGAQQQPGSQEGSGPTTSNKIRVLKRNNYLSCLRGGDQGDQFCILTQSQQLRSRGSYAIQNLSTN